VRPDDCSTLAGLERLQQIFVEHWDGFTHVYPRYHTRYYDGLVDKMLRCGNPNQMGYIEYRCLHCGQGTHCVAMSCKSSLCLRCAKVYVDDWVSQVGQMLHEGVIYRHIVLTVPAILRQTFYQQSKALLSPFMRCGVRCLDDVFSRVSGKNLKGGYIVVIQTHGRNGHYNPICPSSPPVADGINRRNSGYIWTTSRSPCSARSGSGIC
jgi:Transposase zinc-binding domain